MINATIQPYFALESTYFYRRMVGSPPFSHFYEFRRNEQDKDTVVLPSGSMDILFECGENGSAISTFGLVTDITKLHLKTGTIYFGVRFIPGLVPLSLQPLIEHGPRGPEPIALRHSRLSALTSSMSFTEKIAYFLDHYPKHDFPCEGLFTNLVRLILHSAGNISINTIGHQTGYSGRYIHKVFQRHTSINPKSFASIIKFQNAIQTLNIGKYSDLSEIAIDMGYYDHSRFSQSFKHHASITPREYVNIIRSRDYPRFIRDF